MKRKIVALLLAFVLPLTSVNFVGNAYDKNFSRYDDNDYIEYLINKENLKNRKNDDGSDYLEYLIKEKLKKREIDNLDKKELEKEIKKLEKKLKSANKELEKEEKLSFWQKAKNVFANTSSTALGIALFAGLAVPLYGIFCATVGPEKAKEYTWAFLQWIPQHVHLTYFISNKDDSRTSKHHYK